MIKKSPAPPRRRPPPLFVSLDLRLLPEHGLQHRRLLRHHHGPRRRRLPYPRRRVPVRVVANGDGAKPPREVGPRRRLPFPLAAAHRPNERRARPRDALARAKPRRAERAAPRPESPLPRGERLFRDVRLREPRRANLGEKRRSGGGAERFERSVISPRRFSRSGVVGNAAAVGTPPPPPPGWSWFSSWLWFRGGASAADPASSLEEDDRRDEDDDGASLSSGFADFAADACSSAARSSRAARALARASSASRREFSTASARARSSATFAATAGFRNGFVASKSVCGFARDPPSSPGGGFFRRALGGRRSVSFSSGTQKGAVSAATAGGSPPPGDPRTAVVFANASRSVGRSHADAHESRVASVSRAYRRRSASSPGGGAPGASDALPKSSERSSGVRSSTSQARMNAAASSAARISSARRAPRSPTSWCQASGATGTRRQRLSGGGFAGVAAIAASSCAAERRGDGQRGVRARDARGRDQTLGVDILEGPIERTVVERVESVAADGVGSRLDAVVILKRGKLEVEPNLRRERRRRRADHRLQPLVQRVARGAGGERRCRSVRRGPAAHAPDPARRPGGASAIPGGPAPERATMRRAAVEVRQELRERRPRSERRGRAPGAPPRARRRRSEAPRSTTWTRPRTAARGRATSPARTRGGATSPRRASGRVCAWRGRRRRGRPPCPRASRSSRPARSGPPRPGSRGAARRRGSTRPGPRGRGGAAGSGGGGAAGGDA